MSKLPDAFLVHQNTGYIPEPGPYAPGETGVTRLIEGVCARFPSQSRAILRERIFSRQPLTDACRGMIKVVAKRASILDEDRFAEAFLLATHSNVPITVHPSTPPSFTVLDSPKKFSNLEEASRFAVALKPNPGKPVSCVLVNAELEVIAYAWNTNTENRTQHAELNLIRSLYQKGIGKIPENASLIITLKPCAMCAAQIFLACEAHSRLKIFYLEDDPGPKAKNSVLRVGSPLWKKAGEPEIQLAHLKFDF